MNHNWRVIRIRHPQSDLSSPRTDFRKLEPVGKAVLKQVSGQCRLLTGGRPLGSLKEEFLLAWKFVASGTFILPSVPCSELRMLKGRRSPRPHFSCTWHWTSVKMKCFSSVHSPLPARDTHLRTCSCCCCCHRPEGSLLRP